MKISIERIRKDLLYITSIQNPLYDKGCTRHSYSDEDAQARAYLLAAMKTLALEVQIDGVGNIRGRYNGNLQTPSIMIGSHIDTVTMGGKYDGLLGVLVALEVIRTLKENNVATNYPIELVIFAEEEGSNFGVTMLGSKILSGRMGVDKLKDLHKGEISAYETIQGAGFPIEDMYQPIATGDIKAMVELHIEQGGMLDKRKYPIGVVTGIAGMETVKVVIEGQSNHAGTTPMTMRQDPLVCAADIIVSLTNQVMESNISTTVATVGRMELVPGALNVIAKTATFYVDIRDIDPIGIENTLKLLERLIETLSEKHHVKGSMEIVASSPIVHLSDHIISIIEESANKLRFPFMRLHSGAVHDSVMLSDITEVGMIFLPSYQGISHSPDEETDEVYIEMGANLLLETVIRLSES